MNGQSGQNGEMAAPKLLTTSATFPQTKRALSGDRAIPKREELEDYKQAVAGHAGTLCDADGELFIKPCTQSEINFYEDALKSHSEFAELMPRYFGQLELTEATTDEMIHAQIPGIVAEADVPEAVRKDVQSHLHLDQRPAVVSPVRGAAPELHRTITDPGNGEWVPNKSRKITTDRAVVLLNSSFGYKKANIMDAKLGFDLAAPEAPQAKKDRFREIAETTTHKNYGFRVAGMRVYQGPLHLNGSGANQDNVQDEDEGFKIYDKYWGRNTVNDDNVRDMLLENFFRVKSAGIDEELSQYIVAIFLAGLEKVEEILMKHESRMFSSSLLFVFEGDGKALRAALEKKTALGHIQEAELEALKQEFKNAPRHYNNPVSYGGPKHIDSGIDMDDGGNQDSKIITIPFAAVDDGSDDGDEEDDGDMYDELSAEPGIYSLKLIDFAHAKFVPGEGPDENVLKGVRGLIKLLKQMPH